jgi:hypothetical protein
MQETAVQQSQESLRNLPVLYKPEQSQLIQQHPMQQAIQLWANIADQQTVAVYQQAAGKTWDLFRQAIAIIFFLCQLLIALIIWVSGLAFQLGRILRYKVEVETPTLDQMVSALCQVFLWPLAWAYDWATSFIKKYLGWDNPLTTKSSSSQSVDTAASEAAPTNSTAK